MWGSMDSIFRAGAAMSGKQCPVRRALPDLHRHHGTNAADTTGILSEHAHSSPLSKRSRESHPGRHDRQNRAFVGLCVHRDTIAVSVNDLELRKTCFAGKNSSHDRHRHRYLMGNFRAVWGAPQCCYEATSCGYTLYRTLRGLGFACEVIAPSSAPRRVGGRIKTDRRDAKSWTRIVRPVF